MILKIRNSYFTRGFALLLIINLLAEIIQPTVVMALTGGPSQPEVQGFTPIGTSENVDLSSGAFNYNIPLIDVGGYPINMSYSSGVTMDQEASWVGLGWSLNPGVVNRNMRGIPDDFKGDQIVKEFNMKPNVSAGVSGSLGAELFGLESGSFSGSLSFGMGINWNSYDGYGFSMTLSPSFDFSKTSGDGSGNTSELGLGVGLTASDDGLNINPSLSLGSKEKDSKSSDVDVTKSVGVTLPFHSRGGFTGVSVNCSVSNTKKDEEGLDKVIVNSKGTKRAGGIGSTISMVSNTYIPMVEFPKINGGVSFSGKLGIDFFGLDGTVSFSGYYARQTLKYKIEALPAYGYLNSQEGQNIKKVIHDFNREKDVSYTKGTPNLPLTNYTYDVYTASGQGVGGMFRPFRSDIGHMYDSKVSSEGIDGSLGLEFGSGNLIKGGVDVDVNFSGSYTKKWDNGHNKAKNVFKFSNFQNGSDLEPVYYKQVGELAVDEDPLFENMKSFDPVAIKLKHTFGIQIEAMKTLFSDTEDNITIDFQTKRASRSKRNTLFSTLTVKEAVSFGIPTGHIGTKYPALDHHTGEITVTRNDGVRYVYGIAAYNTLQKETTFNVGQASEVSGLVTYEDGDNSSSNSKGIDHFYSNTTLPPFAHSYLLTSVLSPDYVDRENDGITPDDYGTYTKFIYKKKHSEYKWRVPYAKNSANYNEGLRTMAKDNKGSYVYGKKEIWYLEKIETKTHVGIFHTLDNREDSYDVADENGGTGSNRMSKLDKISLYAKPDYDLQISNASHIATPIKEVHFEYDYYLCPGVDNNVDNGEVGDGKLTLREVYFTYGHSMKGKLSAYNFKYGDTNGDGIEDANGNKAYDLKAHNMWGNYKPNGTNPNNAEFPYVDQNKDNEAIYSSQWHLTNIVLPSGSEMRVNYESNDYLNVQNKQAMQFLNVVGCSQNEPISINNLSDLSDDLWGSANNAGVIDEHLWTVVKIPEELQGEIWTELMFKNRFLIPLGNEPIRFNYLMNLSVDGLNPSLSEYVSGYATIDESADYDNSGVISIAGVQYGYFKFNPVTEENSSMFNPPLDSHPIAKSAWQWVRMNNPHLAYDQNGGTFDDDPDATSIIEAMAASVNSFAEVFNGPNGFIRNKGMGKKFNTNLSWVRLPYAGEGKLGGGTRVKKVELLDQWEIMSDGTAAGDRFGQVYTYELKDGKSSGVATFEPLSSKENAIIQPHSYTTKRFGVSDEKYMLEKPYGLSFFPSPKITYSRVEVKSLDKEYGAVSSRNRTGKVVTSFFTTKDFPTVVRQTKIDKKPFSPGLITSLLKLNVREHATVSQGYVVELNDMDGKMKSQEVYAENNPSPISGVIYRYGMANETQNYSNGTSGDPFENVVVEESKLNNKVLTISPDGTVEENLIGIESDVITDFRQMRSENISGGVDGNLATFLASIAPIPVPTLLPTFSRQNTIFRSAVTTKVINRYGILRETVAFDNGASVSTENIAWDSETGSVLLTKTKNEFGDAFYAMNFPAHWTYERMGQAYKNINLVTSSITQNSSTGYCSGAGVEDLVKGDELIVTTGNTTQKGWVLKKNLSGSTAYLIDADGNTLTISGVSTAKVVRSGRRNMHDTSVGQLTMKTNPIRDNDATAAITTLRDDSFNASIPSSEVISASATEFSEDWGLQCGVLKVIPGNCVCTPSQVGTDFFNLINTLIDDNVIMQGNGNSGYVNTHVNNTGDVTGNGIDLSSIPEYTGSLLPSSIPSNYLGDLYVYAPINSINPAYNNDQVSFTFGPNYEWVCNIVLTAENWSENYSASFAFYNSLASSIYSNTISFQNLQLSGDACDGVATIDMLYGNHPGIQGVVTFKITSTCFDFFDCISSPDQTEVCGLNPGDIVNPFRENIQGNWRPFRGYTKLGERNQIDFTNVNGLQTANTRTQGSYKNFDYFWKYNTSPTAEYKNWKATPANWTWTSTITPYRGYDQDGMERENMDALYRFSSSINGYANTLPIAVSANATYRQIAYDGFEDYDFYTPDECEKRHFAFDNVTLSKLESHTGRYSLELGNAQEAVISRRLITEAPDVDAKEAPYLVRDCECQGTFGPETYNVQQFEKNGVEVAEDKKYVISYWIKRPNVSNLTNEYFNADLEVSTDVGSLNLNNLRKSNIIDGWQKIEHTFIIPGDITANSTKSISIKFSNQEGNKLFIDDIRIQPFNSAMKTYVYDPISFRLMAELDDNNFATLYEYDEEGSLIRIKKETAKGIMTIQESRNGIIKKKLIQ